MEAPSSQPAPASPPPPPSAPTPAVARVELPDRRETESLAQDVPLISLPSPPRRLPTQILPHLYVGSQYEAVPEALKATPIRFILNLRGGAYACPPGFRKLVCPISDYGTQKLQEVLLPRYYLCCCDMCSGPARVLQAARQEGKAVLVHCQGGINRSPTVVLAYLVLQENMSLKQAWELLKACYPRASPHELYWKQLRELEEARTGRPSTLSAEEVGPTLQELMRGEKKL